MDALEADFQRVYGLDLGGLWRGEFTVRRAAALAANLPPGSAVWRELHANAEWDQGDYILAAIFDRLGSKESEPYPRPADVLKKQQHEERALVMARAFQQREKRRAARPA